MSAILTVADWMLTRPVDTHGDAPSDDSLLGLVAILAASLESASQLVALDVFYERLHAALDTLPPQYEYLDHNEPLAQWLNVAAIAEQQGEVQLAVLITTHLLRCLDGVSRANGVDVEESHCEHIGLVWARRGRMSRTLGELDDAEACYREAIKWVKLLPFRDAHSHALMGLAALAFSRGNVPLAATRARAVLARRPEVMPMYRVQAHQVLLVTERRKGKLLEALLHGWEAYDNIPNPDPRRLEVLISMARIALEVGDLDAAAAGFSSANVPGAPMRVRVPALVGSVETALNRPDDAVELSSHLNAMKSLLREHLSPAESADAMLALAQGEVALGRVTVAQDYLRKASAIANAHGFFEKQFKVDEIETRISRAAADTTRRSAVPLVKSTKVKSSAGLTRLVELCGKSGT